MHLVGFFSLFALRSWCAVTRALKKLNSLCNRNGIGLLRGTSSIFNYNSRLFSSSKSQAMFQAARHRPLAAEDIFDHETGLCEVWSGQSDSGTDVILRILGFTGQYHSTHVPYPCSCTCWCVRRRNVNQSHYRPEVPRTFQEVKVARLGDNGTEW